KVSAVPFQNWAPDAYEGAPTPITAFMSVATKAAGFVALIELIFIGFLGRDDVIRPMMFILAALTMFVGNVIALRQTNIVRLFAYSSIAQAGFILAPLAVVTGGDPAVMHQILQSMVMYLVAYTVMNLGAFAVIIAVSRRTGTGELDSWGGLFNYAPALAVTMAVFLFSLGGIPPMVGWLAKFRLFQAVVGADTASGYVMGGIMAINTVISLAYYLGIVRRMFIDDAPDGDHSPIRVPLPLVAAMGVAAVALIVTGVLPGTLSDLAKSASLAAG
ncbi:MAG: NADH-quinone oxidoreductase subunit N, partial [Acidimicrobiales bacterium]|nr:NADH-quinone oxidoreductase subunit N [Acidimicrobiales bacterium]